MILFLSQCDEFEQTNCGMTQKLPISFNSLPQQRELIILHFLKIIDGVERDQKENEENIRQSRSFHTITD